MANAGAIDRHETLLLRLEVGHESVVLTEPKRSFPCDHTHRWTVFVRGEKETPLDPSLIQKVVFHLHDDFPNPKRLVSAPPFEVTETGYGGFNIPIYILFSHSKQEHYLEYDMTLKYTAHDKNKETKVIEFKDPKPDLRLRLLKAGAEIVPNKSSKAPAWTNSFRDLFGETLRLAAPSTSAEKTKLPASSMDAKLQSGSPSGTNGLPIKSGRLSTEKAPVAASVIDPRPRTPHQLDVKRRKSKDSGRSGTSTSSIDKHGFYAGSDIHHKLPYAETNGAAQCLLDASKLPPFVSPLNDGVCGQVFPSTSNSSERRSVDGAEMSKPGKSTSKIRRKDTKQSTGISSTSKNGKTAQNGVAAEEKAKRRRNDKSDSGLDSDYSSGAPNVHSPGISNGQNANGGHDSRAIGSALFSPPDSVRSLDTLQESPASAASSSSAASGISATNAPKRQCLEHSASATTSSIGASSDQHRLRMLRLLQHKIMTVKERRIAQSVADLISTQASFDVTSDCLEFDLCSLDSELVQRLLGVFDFQHDVSIATSDASERRT